MDHDATTEQRDTRSRHLAAARQLVAALIAHYHHHTGQTDWNALADWLATNWGNRQWRSLAHVSRLPEPDPNVQRTALALLRQVDTPGATTRRELIAADTARRTPAAS